MAECRIPEREVEGSKPTAAVLCPWARHFTPRKYWLITQEAVAPSRHDWKIVDWDVKPQHKQNKLSSFYKLWSVMSLGPSSDPILNSFRNYLKSVSVSCIRLYLLGDSLILKHNGKQFSTIDKDRDDANGNCAEMKRSGWWFENCAHANLNGFYYTSSNNTYKGRGIFWSTWEGWYYSLTRAEMKIRRKWQSMIQI